MTQIHNFLISQWIAILVAFTLVSLPFIHHAKLFKHGIEEVTSKGQFDGKKVKLQIFTYTVQLHEVGDFDWQTWRECISIANLSRKNSTLFLLDCLWAFLLIGLIYLASSIRYTSFNNS